MTPLLQRARDLLQRLRGLSDATAVTTDNQVTAKAWSELIEGTLQTLERHDFNLVFVGNVGVGKSSLISVSTELFLGESPHDKAALQEASVLPLAAGRTTAFEIRLRESDGDPPRIGLELEPMDEEDMLREFRLFAEGEWRRRRDTPRRVDDDAGSTAIETDRVLRGMTGYAEKFSVDPTTKRRRLVRPLDTAVAPFATLDEFSDHVIARANLAERKQTTWTCANMEELKGLLARIHHGEEPSASLPERVTLIVPRLLRELADGLRLVVVDTRGLDGQFESRADLQQILRDPRSIPVLCSSFPDAPDESTRAVLRSAQADPSMAETLGRALLVLIDRDDASQVDGANGDRDSGQDLKIDECNTTLHNAGLSALSRDQVIAFDLFQDDRGLLLQAIHERLTTLRRSATEKLEQHLDDAYNFLENQNGPRQQLYAQVDRRLSGAATAQRLRGAPLRDPLQGALEAIRATRYASVVYASCRRNGAYLRLNVYAAIDAVAARAATEWLDSLKTALTREFEQLKADPSFDLVNDHIRLREQQFTAAHAAAIRSYAAGVSAEAKRALEKEPVWWTCSAEWGDGPGFKERVLAHLEGWSRRQQSVTAHERTEFAEKIPFAELDRPPEVPRFTLSVRNLRALGDVRWTPSPVSLLVGANGVGKTTLLDVLRLLRRAYDSGLAAAVTEVFRGSNNLRSWSAREGETIEVGLTLGDYVWTIALVPRDGTVEQVTHERLTDRDREVFVRDSLGSFIYQGEHLEATAQLGLRVLAEERRVPDPAVRGVAALLNRISVYRDPDLWSLRENGSRASDNLDLPMRGTNALAVLRRWADDRTQQHRYKFVLGGLRDAFPGVVEAIDFVQAGNTVTARIYRPGSEAPGLLADEANGVLQLLVLLCDVASAEDGSLLAIDEPENGLHPYAARVFLRRANRWSRQHRVTILLATHSLVLLDEFNGQPHQVYVLKGKNWEGPRLLSLAELPDPERLEGFKLGDLYEQGELGSNEDDA